jgi:hypothetical protein
VDLIVGTEEARNDLMGPAIGLIWRPIAYGIHQRIILSIHLSIKAGPTRPCNGSYRGAPILLPRVGLDTKFTNHHVV